jgi:hypothetical protein
LNKQPGGAIRDYLRAAAERRRPSDSGQCLDEERLLEFYSEALDQSEAERIRNHLAECPHCLGLAREAQQFLRLMSEPGEPASGQSVFAPSAAGTADAPIRDQRRVWWQRLADYFRPGPVLAFSVVVAVVSAFLIVEVLRLRTQIEQMRAAQSEWQLQVEDLGQQLAQERQRAEQLAAVLQQERPRVEPGKEASDRVIEQKESDQRGPGPERVKASVATFVLTPVLVRDPGQGKPFELSASTSQVKLQVNFNGDNYKSYHAVLSTADGVEIWNARRLSAQTGKSGKVIELNVSPSRFVNRDYVLTLIGVTSTGVREEVERYPFSVVRK